MTGQHDLGPNLTDLSLEDQLIACQAQIAAFIASRAAPRPHIHSVSDAWRDNTEALIKAQQIMARTSAVIQAVTYRGNGGMA